MIRRRSKPAISGNIWSQKNSHAAKREGWNLSANPDGTTCIIRVTYVRTVRQEAYHLTHPEFKSNAEALEFVNSMVDQGSELHIKAMSIVVRSQMEFKR